MRARGLHGGLALGLLVGAPLCEWAAGGPAGVAALAEVSPLRALAGWSAEGAVPGIAALLAAPLVLFGVVLWGARGGAS